MTSDFFIGDFRQKILQNLGLVNVLIKIAVRKLFRPAVARILYQCKSTNLYIEIFENSPCENSRN